MMPRDTELTTSYLLTYKLYIVCIVCVICITVGVGARSTLGGHDIFARKICIKN